MVVLDLAQLIHRCPFSDQENPVSASLDQITPLVLCVVPQDQKSLEDLELDKKHWFGPMLRSQFAVCWNAADLWIEFN